jgi:hypothetical protein
MLLASEHQIESVDGKPPGLGAQGFFPPQRLKNRPGLPALLPRCLFGIQTRALQINGRNKPTDLGVRGPAPLGVAIAEWPGRVVGALATARPFEKHPFE